MLIGKRKEERPPARWTGDPRKVAGGRWIRIAKNWVSWSELGEV